MSPGPSKVLIQWAQFDASDTHNTDFIHGKREIKKLYVALRLHSAVEINYCNLKIIPLDLLSHLSNAINDHLKNPVDYLLGLDFVEL